MESTSVFESLLRVAGFLAALVALSYALLPALKRFKGQRLWASSSSSAIQIQARTMLPGQSPSVLYVIEVESKRFLIGATAHHLRLLAELNPQKAASADEDR